MMIKSKQLKIKYLFENSIKKHLKCDVDVGLFLSGGTDSTSIASVINKYHKIRTFTYDFQNSDRGEGYIAKKSKN